MRQINLVEGKVVAPEGMKVGIVAARFNEIIVNKLLGGAVDGLVRHGVEEENITAAWVPGAFEIPISSTSIVTFITTPPPLTAPGNSEIFGAPASPSVGSLTGCVLKTGCPSWRTRSPGARASIGTMGSGRKTGKGRFPIRTGCALPLILRWRNAPLIWTNFSI